MDAQKTMDFILQQQAKAEGQMAAIRKLIQAGMRMIVENEQHIKEVAVAQKLTQKELRELAAAQRVTDGKLRGLIDALRRGGNGSRRKN
jgi:hypothetical protein